MKKQTILGNFALIIVKHNNSKKSPEKTRRSNYTVMLNRRNLRIKVMQALYASRQNPSMKEAILDQYLCNSIQQSYSMVIYILMLIIKVIEFDEVNYKIKSAKLLKDKSDTHPPVKLSDNRIIQAICKDHAFQHYIKKENLTVEQEDGLIKSSYEKLIKSNPYNVYIQSKLLPEDEKKLLLFLFRSIIQREDNYQNHLEDIFPNWLDDKHIVTYEVLSILKKLGAIKDNKEKNKILSSFIKKEFVEEKQFSLNLLKKTIVSYDDSKELIESTLKNWMIDRISLIDMVLLSMALCELTHFANIPVKVTLNEYIEISKIYSTEKSKEFINGILDKIMKDLKKQGKIKKTGRGLTE